MSNIIELRKFASDGTKGAKRKFAVASMEPAVKHDWCTGYEWHNANQRWELRVWQRVHDRGFVAYLEGGGQWANRGDHGSYIGTGETAEAALNNAWPWNEHGSETPDSLVAACQAKDTEECEVE